MRVGVTCHSDKLDIEASILRHCNGLGCMGCLKSSLVCEVRHRGYLFATHRCKAQQQNVLQVTRRKQVFTFLRQLLLYEVGLELGPLALPKPVTAFNAKFHIGAQELLHVSPGTGRSVKTPRAAGVTHQLAH